MLSVSHPNRVRVLRVLRVLRAEMISISTVPFFILGALPHVALLLSSSTLSKDDSPSSSQRLPASIPVLEVVKAYGSLAGSECYGRQAPLGSSCQLPLADLQKELGLLAGTSSSFLSETDFLERLEALPFQWPLKPYGIDKSSSLTKTAIVNKGAETRVYMEELERRGMYDPRNPTGPLPTSLRPKLNQALNQEKMDPQAVSLIFRALSSSSRNNPNAPPQKNKNDANVISATSLKDAFRGETVLDYYEFLNLIGTSSISWP
eukprot:scaffold108793_cov46-Attheya_sp.AAC.5